jgi:hypothetical protein
MFSLSPKVWLVIIIALAIGGVAWKLHHDDVVIDGQKKDIVVKDVTIERQGDTIATDKVVDTVKETVNTEVGKGVEKITQKVQHIAAKQETAERVIDQQYSSLPKTSDNVIAQAEDLSSTRIASAWDVYCTADPGVATCQPAATPGVPHV